MRRPDTDLKIYIPPPPRHFKNEGGVGGTLVKHWTSLYLFLQLRETNSVPAFRVRDPGLIAWYGYGGVLIWRNAESFVQNPVKGVSQDSLTDSGGCPVGGVLTGRIWLWG